MMDWWDWWTTFWKEASVLCLWLSMSCSGLKTWQLDFPRIPVSQRKQWCPFDLVLRHDMPSFCHCLSTTREHWSYPTQGKRDSAPLKRSWPEGLVDTSWKRHAWPIPCNHTHVMLKLHISCLLEQCLSTSLIINWLVLSKEILIKYSQSHQLLCF